MLANPNEIETEEVINDFRKLFTTHVLIYYFEEESERVKYDFVIFNNVKEFKKDANFEKIKEISVRKLQDNKRDLRGFNMGVNLALVQLHILLMKAEIGIPSKFYEAMTLQSNIFRERSLVQLKYNLRGGKKQEKTIELSSKGKKRVIKYLYV
jgi:hypothetical protein